MREAFFYFLEAFINLFKALFYPLETLVNFLKARVCPLLGLLQKPIYRVEFFVYCCHLCILVDCFI